ncbi:MAG: hypothetical protein J4452_04370 [Candidatus Aenigmarchaeota archaeon]|nr:hypothetical protein [Candidatus Aenigmarchaeota archaeon]
MVFATVIQTNSNLFNPKNINQDSKISPELAEILGLLSSDGTYYKYLSFERRFFKKRGKYYFTIQEKERIDFGNTNFGLLKSFQKLLLKEFGYKTKITGKEIPKINITKKSIIKDLLKFTYFGFDRWKVPQITFNSPNNVKASYVRGIYEGDGVKLQKNSNGFEVRIEMMNKAGLEQIKILLLDLGINSSVSTCGKGMYRLYIRGIENITKFKEIIKPKFKTIKLGWQNQAMRTMKNG